jgi:hypothetical protein
MKRLRGVWAFKGTETAALPTLAAERRVIDAFQT